MAVNKQTAKYSIQELLGIGFTLVVLGIGLAYGLDVNSDIKTDFAEESCASGGFSYNLTADQCNNGTHNVGAPESAQYNTTDFSATAVSKITDKVPTIATVVVAAVVIGILVTYLWARF